MGRAIRCSNDMADRMETDKDIREMSLFDYFFFLFYAKINSRDEILEPPNFEASKFFYYKIFCDSKLRYGIIRIMINLTYENLYKENLTFYETNEI